MNNSKVNNTSYSTILKIALPTPLRQLFDYLPPAENNSNFKLLIPGMRVLVPFGTRTMVGIIIELSNSTNCNIEQLKSIIQTLDPISTFDNSLLNLLIWSSKYYHYSLGNICFAALPTWLRNKKNSLAKFTELRDIVDIANIDKLKSFEAKTKTNAQSILLNHEQQLAVYTIKEKFNQFNPILLDGVTGSGKTEVYMQLIDFAVTNGKQALILIPEINLTPQTLSRFKQRFKNNIVVMHSQIGSKSRLQAWLQAKNGMIDIVIGTRLAAFIPLKNPGLFIIDEEHDLSFKQQDGFRYSARDILIKRAQLENCPILLGSATPSLETWYNATNNKRYQYLKLTKRAGVAKMPKLEILDIRHRKLQTGLSSQLLAYIQQHLDNGGQILLFLNRRGFSPVLICYQCGWHQTCIKCDSNMVVHQQPTVLRCHHCNSQRPIPLQCPKCSDNNLSFLGIGTERIESTLKKLFPLATVARVDSDTVKNKNQLQQILDDIHSGKINILIGTQMLAKGHHFPNLTLVAIIDIDNALFSADFRATERMGQLIIQVAGRAGRELISGSVVLQTANPTHPLLTTLITQGYHDFLHKLLEERREIGLPPFSYQALVRARSKKSALAMQFLQTIKNSLKSITWLPDSIQVFGPIPAPMEKRLGYIRFQLLLQGSKRKELHDLLNIILEIINNQKVPSSLRWSIDMDPLDMF